MAMYIRYRSDEYSNCILFIVFYSVSTSRPLKNPILQERPCMILLFQPFQQPSIQLKIKVSEGRGIHRDALSIVSRLLSHIECLACESYLCNE